MKYVFNFLVLIIVSGSGANAQTTSVDCNLMNLVVNVSDTDYVQLYHPGHYLTHPQNANVLIWEITDSQGNVIAYDSLVDQSGFGFFHSTPITELMNVSVHLINDSAVLNGTAVHCLIDDQLFWEETEILPGVFNGRWEFMHGNTGQDMNASSGIETTIHQESIGDGKMYDLIGRELKTVPYGQLYLQNGRKKNKAGLKILMCY